MVAPLSSAAVAAPAAGPAGAAAPRALFVYNDLPFFLSYRVAVARALQARGYDIRVATPPGDGAERLTALGFAHHPFPLSRRGARPRRELASVLALRRLYGEVRPALIEQATIKPVIYGSLALRTLGGPPVVNYMTGLGYVFVATGAKGRAARRAVTAAYRVALRLPRMRVIFENPDNRDAFVGGGLVDAGDAVCIRGGGVDMTRFVVAPEPPGAPVVTLPTRMLWHKGVGDFVQAARELRAGGVRARFVLAGDTDAGNPSAVPRAQLEAWHAEGAVEWWGHRADMPAVYAQSSVICLPSAYGEGVPRVLIEGAASGRALVATDTPGCREIVRDGTNGLLVAPRSSASLSAALAALVSDAGRRRAMGAAGRQIAVDEFSIERVIAETLRVYEGVLRAGR